MTASKTSSQDAPPQKDVGADSDKATITRGQYLALHGLRQLAIDHQRRADDAIRAMAEILGEPDEGGGYFGHVSDVLAYDPPTSVAELLRKVGAKVEARGIEADHE